MRRMMGQSIQALIKYVDNTRLEGISKALKDRIRIQKILRSWEKGVKKTRCIPTKWEARFYV